jgi:hypothetical protein
MGSLPWNRQPTGPPRVIARPEGPKQSPARARTADAGTAARCMGCCAGTRRAVLVHGVVARNRAPAARARHAARPARSRCMGSLPWHRQPRGPPRVIARPEGPKQSPARARTADAGTAARCMGCCAGMCRAVLLHGVVARNRAPAAARSRCMASWRPIARRERPTAGPTRVRMARPRRRCAARLRPRAGPPAAGPRPPSPVAPAAAGAAPRAFPRTPAPRTPRSSAHP